MGIVGGTDSIEAAVKAFSKTRRSEFHFGAESDFFFGKLVESANGASELINEDLATSKPLGVNDGADIDRGAGESSQKSQIRAVAAIKSPQHPHGDMFDDDDDDDDDDDNDDDDDDNAGKENGMFSVGNTFVQSIT